MKRRAEIAEELAKLRETSHPGEYYDEVLRTAVRCTALAPPIMRAHLRDLHEAQPEIFADAIRGMDLPPARPGNPGKYSDTEFLLASFLHAKDACGVGMAAWARGEVDRTDRAQPEEAPVSAEALGQRLRRARKLYETDDDFRAAVEEMRELLSLAGT